MRRTDVPKKLRAFSYDYVEGYYCPFTSNVNQPIKATISDTWQAILLFQLTTGKKTGNLFSIGCVLLKHNITHTHK